MPLKVFWSLQACIRQESGYCSIGWREPADTNNRLLVSNPVERCHLTTVLYSTVQYSTVQRCHLTTVQYRDYTTLNLLCLVDWGQHQRRGRGTVYCQYSTVQYRVQYII